MSHVEAAPQKKGSAVAIIGITVGIIVVLCLLVAGIGVMSYFSAANKGNQAENRIDEIRQNSASNLSNLTMRIQEMAQVPDMAVGHLKELIQAQMSGRYGADGSKAVVQFLKEQNVSVDQRMYLNIQSEISGGRKEFEITQNRLMGQCRNYKDELGNAWSGFWLRLAGYPKGDLKELCRAVTDAKTDSAFSTGQQTKISLK